MIFASLSFLNNAVNNFMALKDPLNTAGTLKTPVVLTSVVDQANALFLKGGDYVYMSIVNIEEETTFKAQLPYYKTADDKLNIANPDIKLNIYIQFAAYSDGKDNPVPVGNMGQEQDYPYQRSLLLLDQVVYFFQYRNVFTANQYPFLQASGIEKLILEPVSLTFEQLNHLWATLGAKYLPSMIYKCSMLTFRESVISPERPLVKQLIIDEISK